MCSSSCALGWMDVCGTYTHPLSHTHVLTTVTRWPTSWVWSIASHRLTKNDDVVENEDTCDHFSPSCDGITEGEGKRPRSVVVSTPGYEYRVPGLDPLLIPLVLFPKGELPQRSPGKCPNICVEEEWKTILEKNLGTPDRDSSLDLPVIISLVCCKSSALDHGATEMGGIGVQIPWAGLEGWDEEVGVGGGGEEESIAEDGEIKVRISVGKSTFQVFAMLTAVCGTIAAVTPSLTSTAVDWLTDESSVPFPLSHPLK
uniref:Uncharacterized protein n=1 Tax=Timema genevievae TaxID=629358 RepID=A0A7R9PLS4_TIMGE|nr:unnamed protein product [Timema genevievae]